MYPFDPEVTDVALAYHRTCTRVMREIYTVRAQRLEPLYQELAALVAADGRDWVRDGSSISVRARNVAAFAAGERQIVGTVKNAILDGAAQRDVTLRVDPEDADVLLTVRMDTGALSVSVDLGRRSLSRRGYRSEAGRAPLREHLAAVLLMLARWDPRSEALVDPMCGSGTIAIEAALMAQARARDGGGEPLFPDAAPQIVASDRDAAAVEHTRHNAAAAGVEDRIEVSVANVFDLRPEDLPRRGLILMNPPYGARMRVPELEAFYARLGAWCDRLKNYRIGVLVADGGFTRAFGGRRPGDQTAGQRGDPRPLLSLRIMTPEKPHPGRWWTATAEDRIVCELCPRACSLAVGQRGFCYVRRNLDGRMVLTDYGRSSGFCIDPIEKKPLHHFYPGSPVLSFGTAGCNLGCKFCQNWSISKARAWNRDAERAAPEEIADAALRTGAKSVAFTYNDPVIFAEYAIDTARACRDRGLKTVAVTAGYITAAARAEFFAAMDAVNVDLKAFEQTFYYRLTASHLAPVLETLRYLARESNVWLEITTLLIPGWNDGREVVQRECDWIAETLGCEIPLHFTGFHPDFKMRDVPPTPAATLERARAQALASGLRPRVHRQRAQPGVTEHVLRRLWCRVDRARRVHDRELSGFPRGGLSGLWPRVGGDASERGRERGVRGVCRWPASVALLASESRSRSIPRVMDRRAGRPWFQSWL